jgi:hypothetical protein
MQFISHFLIFGVHLCFLPRNDRMLDWMSHPSKDFWQAYLQFLRLVLLIKRYLFLSKPLFSQF